MEDKNPVWSVGYWAAFIVFFATILLFLIAVAAGFKFLWRYLVG